MLEGLAGDTRVIVYLMAGIGVLGILAKIINQLTLYRQEQCPRVHTD